MRQIQLKLTMANSKSLSKFKFTAANPHSVGQIRIQEGKFKFTTAISNLPRQIQIRYSKLKFNTGNSNSPLKI